jgi:arginine utilization protein RocB
MLERLNKLISVASESRTAGERGFENTLTAMIESIPYFREQPLNYGKQAVLNDPWHRHIVWALRDNGSDKTVILYGHHDTVDVTAYGTIQHIARDPEALANYFRSTDALPDDHIEDWLFGRGSCDMKAGLTIGISALEQGDGPNILFVSVPDEEAESAGMRYAARWLDEFKQERLLKFTLSVLLEPHMKSNPDEFPVYTGSVGKMMPFIFVKGDAVHAGEAFSGLSALSILMEIVKAVEANTELSDFDQGQITPPPTFLGLRDLKNQYDVTTPEYAAGYFNWLFLKGSAYEKLALLKKQCVWSVEDAINQYNYSFNAYLRRQGLPSFQCCQELTVEVLYYEELVKRVPSDFNIEAQLAATRVAYPHLSDQMLAIEWTRILIEAVNFKTPVVVIGLLTPYYPAVSDNAYFNDKLRDPLTEALKRYRYTLKPFPYFMGISDMSYMGTPLASTTGIYENMPMLGKGYSLPAPLEGVPSICLGPWGKALHQKGERVLIRDVVKTVPGLLQTIFEAVE